MVKVTLADGSSVTNEHRELDLYIIAQTQHEVAYQDLVVLVRKHANEVSSVELLAIAANMVGKLIALQDQRVITPSMAKEIVTKNIECGNNQVLEQLINTVGSV